MNWKALNRGLCLFLSLILLLGMLPVLATAEETEVTTPVGPAAEEIPIVLTTDSTVDYYGRSALADLPNSTALLYAYDQLAAGVEVSAASITVYNGTDPLTLAELQTVMDAYRRDYTYHFWLDNGYSYYSNSTTVTKIVPKYLLSGTALDTARAAFDTKANALLAGILWQASSPTNPAPMPTQPTAHWWKAPLSATVIPKPCSTCCKKPGSNPSLPLVTAMFPPPALWWVTPGTMCGSTVPITIPM